MHFGIRFFLGLSICFRTYELTIFNSDHVEIANSVKYLRNSNKLMCWVNTEITFHVLFCIRTRLFFSTKFVPHTKALDSMWFLFASNIALMNLNRVANINLYPARMSKILESFLHIIEQCRTTFVLWVYNNKKSQ